MVRLVVEGKLLRWGNSLGVRISKADEKRLAKAGYQVGDVFNFDVLPAGEKIDLSWLHTFKGDGTTGRDHDRVLGEALEEEWAEKQARIARQRKGKR